MTLGKRRQVILVGLLMAVVVGYLRFGGGFGSGEAAAGPAEMPAIDVAGLFNAIKDVATIDPRFLPGPRPDSDPDRNLFQYGNRRPPPPTPAEKEAIRLAEQARLAEQEQLLRQQKEQERLAEEMRKQQELAQQNLPPPPEEDPTPKPPPPPPKPTAPAINFKLLGMMGPSDRKFGVFVDGDKVMMARKGEVLLGQFKVLSIGPESAEIGFVDPAFKDEKRKLQLGQ